MAAKRTRAASGGKKSASSAAAKDASKRAEEIRRRNSALDDVTVGAIRDSASGVHQQVNKRGKPDMSFPIR
jgi:hypothetical protein